MLGCDWHVTVRGLGLIAHDNDFVCDPRRLQVDFAQGNTLMEDGFRSEIVR